MGRGWQTFGLVIIVIILSALFGASDAITGVVDLTSLDDAWLIVIPIFGAAGLAVWRYW